MAEPSKVIQEVILKEQIAKTVDFRKTRGKISYSGGGQFESFFKKILTEKEIIVFCQNCVEMIVSHYGTKAYPIQHFEYKHFNFIAQYMDLGEGEGSIYAMFWSLDEF